MAHNTLKLFNYKDEVINLYKNNISIPNIARRYNCYPQSVENLLKTYNVYTSYRPSKGNTRYFKTIDTYLKAYFLGFITADGCIQRFTKSSRGLSITLNIKDICILDKLKQEIGNSHNIRIWSQPQIFDKTVISTYCRFQIADKKLYEDLSSYGLTERKSLTIPNIILNIPKKFRKAFILGYFDGGGSVILPKQKSIKGGKEYPNRTITVSIRGTKPFLEGIVQELDITNYSLVFSKQYSLNISKKTEVVKFYKCYNNCPFYLERKYNKFQDRLKHISFQRILQDQTISSS